MLKIALMAALTVGLSVSSAAAKKPSAEKKGDNANSVETTGSGGHGHDSSNHGNSYPGGGSLFGRSIHSHSGKDPLEGPELGKGLRLSSHHAHHSTAKGSSHHSRRDTKSSSRAPKISL